MDPVVGFSRHRWGPGQPGSLADPMPGQRVRAAVATTGGFGCLGPPRGEDPLCSPNRLRSCRLPCPAPSTQLASEHSCEGTIPQLSHFFSEHRSLIPLLDAEHIAPRGSSPFLVHSLATVSSTPCPWEPPAALNVTHPFPTPVPPASSPQVLIAL